MESTDLVFQPSWAALTLVLAVSSVKGGKGGRDSSCVAIITASCFNSYEQRLSARWFGGLDCVERK